MAQVIEIQPTAGDGSQETGKLVARKSFEVLLSDGHARKKVEVQIGTGVLESENPREYIEKYFKDRRLPENSVIDITPPR
jgi:hypothetical protein